MILSTAATREMNYRKYIIEPILEIYDLLKIINHFISYTALNILMHTYCSILNALSLQVLECSIQLFQSQVLVLSFFETVHKVQNTMDMYLKLHDMKTAADNKKERDKHNGAVSVR